MTKLLLILLGSWKQYSLVFCNKVRNQPCAYDASLFGLTYYVFLTIGLRLYEKFYVFFFCFTLTDLSLEYKVGSRKVSPLFANFDSYHSL